MTKIFKHFIFKTKPSNVTLNSQEIDSSTEAPMIVAEIDSNIDTN